jgi:hypothetical protein
MEISTAGGDKLEESDGSYVLVDNRNERERIEAKLKALFR